LARVEACCSKALSILYIPKCAAAWFDHPCATTTAAAAVLLLLTFAKLAARTDINKLMNGKGEPTNYISWCGAATLNEGEISSATR
jgi:hypothetical protein